MVIETTYSPPPIVSRKYDWVAIFQGYEPGDLVGYGETEQEAIEDLKSQKD